MDRLVSIWLGDHYNINIKLNNSSYIGDEKVFDIYCLDDDNQQMKYCRQQ